MSLEIKHWFYRHHSVTMVLLLDPSRGDEREVNYISFFNQLPPAHAYVVALHLHYRCHGSAHCIL